MSAAACDDEDSAESEANRLLGTSVLDISWQKGVDSGDAGALDFAEFRIAAHRDLTGGCKG